MAATGANREDTTAQTARPLTRAQAVGLAQRYVAAYNDRDLEAMVALQDPGVVSYPARLFGPRVLTGHGGVRAWWQAMVDSGRWYEVVVRDVRLLDADRVAVIGEIRDGGEPVSPWGVVVRIRNGLIVESHSYLSDEQLLGDTGVLNRRSL